MKKLFITMSLTAAVASGYYLNRVNNSDNLSSVMLENIEALADGESSMDCNYIPKGKECSITVSADVAAKIFGITGKGDGSVVVNITGAQECELGGNSTCVPVQCNELYSTIFNHG